MPFVVAWKWVVLIVLALTPLGVQPAPALEGAAPLKQYTTAAVEEDRVLYQVLPQASPKVPEAVRQATKASQEDIQTIYPISEPSAAMFTQAQWVFAEDGAVALLLFLPGPTGGELNLIGTWGQRDGAHRLHMAGGIARRGLAATLDGLLQLSDNGYRLDGIYTVTVRGARHAERLVLRLMPAVNLLPTERTGEVLEKARQRRALEQLQAQERLLSEPDEYIGGVPVASNLDVTLTGEIDSVAFGPLAGQLLLRRAEGLGEPTVYLQLTTNSPIVPGWSSWITHQDLPREPGAEASPAAEFELPRESALNDFLEHLPKSISSPQVPEPGVAVAVEDGRIRITITPAPPFRNLGWYTRNPEYSEDLKSTAPVLVETGAIDLQLTGNQISGSIKAEGQVQSSATRPTSTFNAKLTGRRQAGALLEALEKTVGPHRFGGRWQDPRWGVLDLRQQGATVKGSFAKSGSIEGTTTGHMLDFRWKAPQEGSGRGFLRATGSGLLVGMAWPGDTPADPQPLVGSQVRPSIQAADGAGDFPALKTDAEARELKFFAYDLDSASKHQEAAEILAKVITYYQERAAAGDPGVQKGYLIEQGIAVHTWISSAFEAGDYKLLLDGLAAALNLQRQLVPEDFGLRLFWEQARNYALSLEGNAETMGLLAAAFERGLNGLTSAGIGIDFEAAPDTSGLRITGVAAEMPAARAGLAEGDLLVAIDGITTAAMGLEEASTRLRGPAGSAVTLTLLKDGQQRQPKLTRAPLARVEPPARREDLVKVMTTLRDLAATVQQELTAEAQIVRAPVSGIAAFADLTTRITLRQAVLSDARPRTIALAKQALAGRPEVLDLFRHFVYYSERSWQDITKDRNLDSTTAERMMALDQQIEEFKRSSPANDIDMGLLKLSIHMLTALDSLQIDLAGRVRLVEQAREMAEIAPKRDEIQQTLATLTSWLDWWRARLVTDAGKIQALELGQDVYDRYVQILADLDLPKQALVASEAARARAFMDLMAARSAQDRQDTVNVVGANVLSAFNAPLASLVDLNDTVQRFNATVVEYMVLPEQLMIWVVSPSGRIETRSVSISRVVLERDIRSFLDLIERDVDPSAMQDLIKDQATGSTQLYQQLITPIENLLPTSNNEAILIIPHRELFRIPFAALRNSAGEYLIQKHPILYASSITVAGYAQRNQRAVRTASPTLLALVNPQPLLGPDGRPLSYKPLVWTEQKLKQNTLSKYYPTGGSKILSGPDATAEALQQKAKTYDVIYLATHAEASDEQALDQTFIALAGKPLTVFEVFRSKLALSADLVILGACKTGRGPITGDGVNGLGRAFTYAGAATLLTTLWEVPETITLEFLLSFHDFWLNQRMPKAQAARAAQLKLLENYPFQIDVWSPMVMFGVD